MNPRAQAGTLPRHVHRLGKGRPRREQARTRKNAVCMAYINGLVHFTVNSEVIGINDYSVHRTSP